MKGKIAFAAMIIATGFALDNVRDIQEYFMPQLKEERLARAAEWRAKMEAEEAAREAKREAERQAYLESDEGKAEIRANRIARGKNKIGGQCEMIARSVAVYGAHFDLFRDATEQEYEENGETRISYRTTFDLKNAFGTERPVSLSCQSDIDGNVDMAWVGGKLVLNTAKEIK